MDPRFYFATCQVGAEKAVKEEVLRECPDLRFAFSRPGFITFKENTPQGALLFPHHAVFVRLWGEVIGQAKDPSGLQNLLKSIPVGKKVQYFSRDLYLPGDEPEGFDRNQKFSEILVQFPELKTFNTKTPEAGELIYDLIWVDDFHVFLGRHEYRKGMVPSPGNLPLIEIPEASPSRAYLKIEEAILRFHPEIKKGMEVLEVGCSPGGATTAMSHRGLQVTGVDPKFMDRKVMELPGFRFIQKCARDVKLEDLKNANPDWLVMDMNLAPLEALDELHHVISLLKKIHGPKMKLSKGFLTLKLNDRNFVSSIPLYLKRIEEMGFRNLIPLQLGTNRQEFFVYAESYRS